MKTNENASKIKFMECRMSGQPYKFVLQMENPQCLFQVLELKAMEQHQAFAKKNDETSQCFHVSSYKHQYRYLSAVRHELWKRFTNCSVKL